jgi:hypothetical protein
MARDADLVAVPAGAAVPTKADTLVVQVETRIPGAAVVDASGEAHWRRLLSPV